MAGHRWAKFSYSYAKRVTRVTTYLTVYGAEVLLTHNSSRGHPNNVRRVEPVHVPHRKSFLVNYLWFTIRGFVSVLHPHMVGIAAYDPAI